MRDKKKLQFIDLLKSNFRINNKFVLKFGIFSYLAIIVLVFLNPIMTNDIRESSSLDYAIKLSLIGVMIGVFFNLSIGTVYIIKRFFRNRRWFYLLPFDLDIKIYNLYFYAIFWAILNLIIYHIGYFINLSFMTDINSITKNYEMFFMKLSFKDILFWGSVYLNFITNIVLFCFVKRRDSGLYNFVLISFIIIIENVFLNEVEIFLDSFNINNWNQSILILAINLIILLLILYFLSKKSNVKE